MRTEVRFYPPTTLVRFGKFCLTVIFGNSEFSLIDEYIQLHDICLYQRHTNMSNILGDFTGIPGEYIFVGFLYYPIERSLLQILTHRTVKNNWFNFSNETTDKSNRTCFAVKKIFNFK